MRYSRINSVRVIVKDIFTTHVREGNALRYRFAQLLFHGQTVLPMLSRPLTRLRRGLGDSPIVIRNPNGSFSVTPRDETVHFSSLFYEYHLDEWFERPPRRRLFIDVGANIGGITVRALALGYKRVIAFEPNPSTLPRLVRNVKLNAWKRVTIVPIGLSDKATNARFVANEEHDGLSRFVIGKTRQQTLNVPTITLDAYLRGRRIPPGDVDCIKIDVEGFEERALRGMARTLDGMPHGSRLCVEIWASKRRAKTIASITKRGFVLEESIMDNYLFRKG